MLAATTVLIRSSAFLNKIALWGAVVAVALMVGSSMFQVIARYIFSSPPIWTEELARYAMVWAGMLGASCAFHEKVNPTLFPGPLSRKGTLGLVYACVRGAGVMIFVFPVLWYSFIGPNGGFKRGFLARSMSRTAEMLDVPMVWFTMVIPIAFALIVIHIVAEIAQSVQDLNAPDAARP